MSKLRIMSQNQWNCTNNRPEWAAQGLDCSSAERMKGHARVFKELMPDIVGGQEVNKDMQLDFQLSAWELDLHYTLIWGIMTPVFYRADKLELLASEYLQYPYHLEGMEGFFNDGSKAANLCVFRCKEDGATFIFVNTHLWWMTDGDPNHKFYFPGSDKARMWQIGAAMDLIDKYQGIYGRCPVFFVGDMNTTYHAEPVQYAIRERGYSHAHDIAVEFADPEDGYNGCNVDYAGPGVWAHGPFENAIDHILVRDIPEGAVKRFCRYTPDYYLALSDHAPLYVDVEL